MAQKVIDYKCKSVGSLNVRSGPGMSFAISAKELNPGTIVNCTLEENQWYKHDKGGWSSNVGWKYLSILEDRLLAVTKNTTETTTEQQNTVVENNKQDNYTNYEMSAIEYLDYNNRISSSAFEKLRGIHGMPYQFMKSVDRRTTVEGKDVTYGRTFTDKIITKFPVLILSPGKPGFMKGYSSDKKSGILKSLGNLTGASDMRKNIEDILSGEGGRYYTFEFDYAKYYEYVNGMCRNSAMMLGIGDVNYLGTKLKDYNWSTYVDTGLKGFFSGNEYVCFYIDADDQISDNFSNNVGDSLISSAGDGISELGKELQFILGAGAGIEFDAINPEMYEESINSGIFDELINKYTGQSSIIQKLRDGVKSISVGGQLIFPEIWKDSSFSRSYDVTVKLVSPDADDLSIYLNCLVPLYHLLTFVMPKSMSANSFYSPFLVRGFYKGYFNCDLGIVTDMSITRGSSGNWNANGLPTEIEVRFTIKDLYDAMSMSKPEDGIGKFIGNTPFMDYLANMVGVNLNTPELARTLTYYLVNQGNRVLDLKQNLLLNVSTKASNLFKDILLFK